MKLIFMLTIVFLSTTVFAADKETPLRKLNCVGTITDSENQINIKLVISDYKITYTENGEKFTDYGTVATITDPQNPSQRLDAITNNDGSEDPQSLRDEKRDGHWAGLSFFDLHRKNSVGGKMNRDGLLILGSQKIPAIKTQRIYDVGIKMGNMEDKTAKSYSGSVTCDLTR